MTTWWLLVPVAYLLGSVSFAWWAARAKGVDLRTVGSGNLGATNAGRVLGWHWFAIIFTLDLGKGLGPVLVARQSGDEWLPIAVATAAVLGHVFTCFHGFKGGKAVATSLGVLIALAPIAAGIAFGSWLIAWLLGWAVLKLKRSEAVGPASIVASIVVVPAYLFTPGFSAQTLGFLALLATLILIKHRSNFARFVSQMRRTEEA